MTCGHIGGRVWGENIQAAFPRGKVTEFTHMQEARLAPPKCLQALVPEKLQEQLPKGRQGPLASTSKDTPSWGVREDFWGAGEGRFRAEWYFNQVQWEEACAQPGRDLKPGPFSPGWESLDEVPDHSETHSVCVSGFSRFSCV